MSEIERALLALELGPDASLEDIKQAYRDLVKVWHPDKHGYNPRLQQKAQEKLKQINEAFGILKSYDPKKKVSKAVAQDFTKTAEREPPPQAEAQQTSSKPQSKGAENTGRTPDSKHKPKTKDSPPINRSSATPQFYDCPNCFKEIQWNKNSCPWCFSRVNAIYQNKFHPQEKAKRQNGPSTVELITKSALAITALIVVVELFTKEGRTDLFSDLTVGVKIALQIFMGSWLFLALLFLTFWVRHKLWS